MSINWSFILLLAIIFTNIYIIKSEYRIQKIPNQLLLLLLGFNISFALLSSNEFFLIPSLIKVSLLLIGIIVLFIFKIWNPSYLKYIFVSSLFFLGSGEITYISNIFFLIFLYILFHFFYYYLGIIINFKRLKTYLMAYREKTTGDFSNWLSKNKENVAYKITIMILGFLSVFILIRMLRIFIQGEVSDLFIYVEINNITINTVVFIFILLFIFTAILHNLYRKYLFSNYKYLGLLIALTLSFIVYEFIYDYSFISQYLYKILTFMLILFVFVWIIIRMSKYLFFDHDSKLIDYKQLKVGDIIDKKLISSYLVGQKSVEKYNVKEFIKGINNPINKEDSEKIKEIIDINDKFQKEKGLNPPPNIIRIYNTFLFSPFIFGGFIVTFFMQKNMLIIILLKIYKLIMGIGE